MDTDLDAIEVLRATVLNLFPPGPKREWWLRWVEVVRQEAEERRIDGTVH
jgi:hypothetical protein